MTTATSRIYCNSTSISLVSMYIKRINCNSNTFLGTFCVRRRRNWYCLTNLWPIAPFEDNNMPTYVSEIECSSGATWQHYHYHNSYTNIYIVLVESACCGCNNSIGAGCSCARIHLGQQLATGIPAWANFQNWQTGYLASS